jgi:hypothetical protein
MKVQYEGLKPFTIPRDTYTTVGKAAVFRLPNSTTHLLSSHVSFVIYTGSALVALDGNINGPFIELTSPWSFDFPVATNALYIKGNGGNCEVAVVAAVNPIEP